MHKAQVFEKIYREYLGEVSRIDPARVKDRLGLKLDNGEAVVHFYGVPFRVSGRGVVDNQGKRPARAVCVILCKYLWLCPDIEPAESDWATFKDFKDAAPFVAGFLNNAEKPISRAFSDRLPQLRQACMQLSGRPVDGGITADLVMQLETIGSVKAKLPRKEGQYRSCPRMRR